MIKVTIFALTMPPSPMFEQAFTDAIDADRYEAFWRRLGSCHVKRQTPQDVPDCEQLLLEIA